MSDFRYCKLTREWTLFAPERLRRPNDLQNKKEVYLGKIVYEKCPFDMGKEEYTPTEITRISQDGTWKCRVVPNLYNALSIDVESKFYRDNFFESHTGFGAHEVVIETPNHDKQICNYEFNDFVNYFTILQERTINLQKDSRFKYLSIFKNQGLDAGASMTHSHSQIIALPFLPKKVQEELSYKKSYFKEHGRALMDDIVYEENIHGKNIVLENSDFIVYCPYASKFAFEAKIVAKKRLSSLIEFTKSDLSSLSDITKDFFSKYYNALGEADFNMIVKNAAYEEYNENTKDYFRFHIEIKPRIYKQAGFELDNDVNINVMLPETAAKIYKESK